ncbi:MAG: cell wall hydrolase [Candidatus Omnitrophota bacterium]
MLPEIFLAWSIAREAIGESHYGRQMVASEIVNRSVERKLSPVQVCKQHKQYSAWNSKPSSRIILREIKAWQKKSPNEWGHCLELAVQIQHQLFTPISACTHHYNPELCSPSWKDNLLGKKIVGHHIFGRL